MKKKLFELWATLLTGVLSLGVVFAYSAQKNQREVHATTGGAPTLKLTWDFSANKDTNTIAFIPAALKIFLETYDAPSFTYTVSSTNNTYKGSGNKTDSIADNNWKFSSSKNNGDADISGLPSYTLVKIWVARWSTDVAKLAVNGGTAQSITTNNYDLYTFDGFDNQTSFSVLAVKRSMINKIEFYGC